MIIKKLRLQRGWSQEQLATASGLSIRTIQRIEKGSRPGLESLKSLAAVFEVEISDLQQESSMQRDNGDNEYGRGTEADQRYKESESTYTSRLYVSKEEEDAFEYVHKLKNLYKNCMSYVVVMSALAIFNLITSPEYLWVIWPAAGWGVGIIVQALDVFEVTNLFSAEWERQQVEKRLGRKL